MIILDTVRESYENDSGKDALSRLRVVCRASRVCRSWRLMALQNPLWWTDIAIYMQRFNPVELTAYLERSRNCPLQMRIFRWEAMPIQTTPRLTDNIPKDIAALLNIISSHFHRVHILEVRDLFQGEGHLEAKSSLLERLLSFSLPEVERLTFKGHIPSSLYSKSSSWRNSSCIPLFSATTRLRELRIIESEINIFKIPSQTLTTVHIYGDRIRIKFQDFRDALQVCRILRDLAIYDQALEGPFSNSTRTQFTSLSLRSLSLLGTMSAISELLLSLIVPHLKELTVAPVQSSDLNLFSKRALGTAHFPDLNSITLAPRYPGQWKALAEASAAFSHVTRLILPSVYPQDEFIRMFTDQKALIFPDLCDLSLGGVNEGLFLALKDIIEFRQTHFLTPLRNMLLDKPSFEKIMHYNPNMGLELNCNILEDSVWEMHRKKLLFSDQMYAFTRPPL